MEREGHWDLYRDGFTQGLLAKWLNCRESVYIAYVQGLEKPSLSAPLFYGSLVHGVLEKHYNGDCRKLTILVDEVVNEIHPVGFVNTFEDYVALAEVVLAEYMRFYKHEDRKFKWIQTEHQFDIPYKLPSGAESRMRGMIDGVFTQKGKVWLLETKTASMVNESVLMDRLSFDMQIGFYLNVVRQMIKRTPAGVVYNILRKPLLRKSVKENERAYIERCRRDIASRPDWYFIRYEIRVTKREQQRWIREFNDILADLEEWFQGRGHYRNSGNCDGKYGSCPYLPICSSGNTNGFSQRPHVFAELET